VKALLPDMVALMGFPSEVTTSTSGNKISAHISGEFTKELVGRDGDTLDAIQYLMRKMISQKKYTDKLFFSLDCGDFRDSRETELQELALQMAAKVKETGKTQTIAALNPAERRIVHVTLQDNKAIRSSSVGEGLYKKIRIFAPGKGRKKTSRGPRAGKSRTSTAGAPDQSLQA
nr:RNA-binding protein [Desulfobulbaceae bacterium]